jgi:hypothetical protein
MARYHTPSRREVQTPHRFSQLQALILRQLVEMLCELAEVLLEQATARVSNGSLISVSTCGSHAPIKEAAARTLRPSHELRVELNKPSRLIP